MTTQTFLTEEPDDNDPGPARFLRERRQARRPDPGQVLRVLQAGPVVSDDYVAVQRWAVPTARSRISRAGEACGLRSVDEDAKVIVDEAIGSLYGSVLGQVTSPAGLLCTAIKYRVLDRVRAGETVRLRESPVAPEDFPVSSGTEPLLSGGDGRTLEDRVIDRIVTPQVVAEDIHQIQVMLSDARAAAFMVSLVKAYTGESLKELAEERGLSYGAVRKAAGEARRQVAEFMIGLTGEEFHAYGISLKVASDDVPVCDRPLRGSAQLAQDRKSLVTPEQYLVLVQIAQTKITEFLQRSNA